MVSSTILKPPPESSKSPNGVEEYNGFIEEQLRKTRSYVRMVDIASRTPTTTRATKANMNIKKYSAIKITLKERPF